jgi:Helix-turn-helix of DDE superfamily endonuclease
VIFECEADGGRDHRRTRPDTGEQTLEVITIYDILRLSSQEAPPLAHLQYTDVQDRPTEFLDLTSLTLDAFQLLVAPFEAAFQAHMAAWRLDGKPRTARQFAVYKNCPLPTPEDRLFFILTYLKTYSLPGVQGRLFGMRQSQANQWMHVLLPALLAARRTLGDAPARSLAALAQRLGVTEAAAASVVSSLEEEPAPVATPDAPLLPMTGRNDGLSAPKTLLNRPTVIAVLSSC